MTKNVESAEKAVVGRSSSQWISDSCQWVRFLFRPTSTKHNVKVPAATLDQAFSRFYSKYIIRRVKEIYRGVKMFGCVWFVFALWVFLHGLQTHTTDRCHPVMQRRTGARLPFTFVVVCSSAWKKHVKTPPIFVSVICHQFPFLSEHLCVVFFSSPVWPPPWPVSELPVFPVLDWLPCCWSWRLWACLLRTSACSSPSTGCCESGVW